jgi:hypothetical protein
MGSGCRISVVVRGLIVKPVRLARIASIAL